MLLFRGQHCPGRAPLSGGHGDLRRPKRKVLSTNFLPFLLPFFPEAYPPHLPSSPTCSLFHDAGPRLFGRSVVVPFSTDKKPPQAAIPFLSLSIFSVGRKCGIFPPFVAPFFVPSHVAVFFSDQLHVVQGPSCFGFALPCNRSLLPYPRGFSLPHPPRMVKHVLDPFSVQSVASPHLADDFFSRSLRPHFSRHELSCCLRSGH